MTNCLQQRFAPADTSLSVAYKIARSIAFDHPCIIFLQKELFFCYKISEDLRRVLAFDYLDEKFDLYETKSFGNLKPHRFPN
jgi:hypothetical protein